MCRPKKTEDVLCKKCLQKKRMDKFIAKNPKYNNGRWKKWALNNPEKNKVSKKKWEEENKKAVSAKTRSWQKKNPERVKAALVRFREKNRDKINENRNARRHRRLTPAWANISEIKKLYRVAKIMKKLTGVEYQVDHIIPIKGKIVTGLHIETNLQVITALENRRKQNKFTMGINS